MEIKSSSDTITESRDATENVNSAFENFPWTVLQQSSNGINIINSINQLLSMYHPNDGIVAYERVLKTLLTLSESMDEDLQQQILSIVPLPKGISNDKIRNLIRKTTNLIKSSNSIPSYQKVALPPEDKFNAEVLNGNAEIHLNRNVLINTAQNFELNKKFVSSIPEVFKGFPPNEISTIHSHVRNVNYMYSTLNYSLPCRNPYVNLKQSFSSNINEQGESLKWFHTPHLLYNTNLCQSIISTCQQHFFKSVDDKYFQLSIDSLSNWNQCNVTNVPHMLHQNTNCLKRIYKNNAISKKQNKSEILNSEVTHSGRSSLAETNYEILNNANINSNSKKHNNWNKNKIFNLGVQEYFEQELKYEQQAIQQDIYKMDVVQCEEERKDAIINIKAAIEDDFVMDNLIMHEKLKTSLQNFLRRAEQEILIEVPMLPHTKPLHVASPISNSKCCKFVNKKNLENNGQLDVSNNNSKNVNTSEGTKQFVEKKSSASRQIYQKSHQLQMLNNNPSTVLSKTRTVKCKKKDNEGNVLYKSSVKQMKQKCLNTLQQTASITELATFKKQYYDTLLNIQKAKMAVANSLAISSVESFTKYDPYYSNHSYQQQQLLQQHGPLTVNPQFTMHTMAQSGLANIHNTPYTWVRYSNLRHPTMKQLKLSQQFPLQVSRNKEDSVLHYIKTVDIQCFTQDKSKQMKQGVQRKKLEDIVGKLRDIENSK